MVPDPVVYWAQAGLLVVVVDWAAPVGRAPVLTAIDAGYAWCR